jgi:molybdopterin molybdotransferase
MADAVAVAGTGVLLEVADAWAQIAGAAAPLAAEPAPLLDAVGRVLAADARAPNDLPGFDRSSMDGWAIRSADLAGASGAHVALPVVGAAPAGAAGDVALAPGTAVRIGTGGPLPPGADAVLRLEAGEEEAGVLRPRTAPPAGEFVRRRGEDVRVGDVLVPAGTRIAPAHLVTLASAGLAELVVHHRPRVAILATGSELVPPGAPLRPGQIHESNGTTLAAYVRQAGARALEPGIVPDDPGLTRAALESALEGADVVLTSGGVSVGDRDLVKGALAGLGVEPLFWGVRMKPGKPVFCGRRGSTWVFGLPGNPLSTVVNFLVFVAPLLRRLAGEPDAVARTVPAILGAESRAEGGRTTYATARLREGRAFPTEKQGSHMTSALAEADGFVVIPHERATLPAGERVDVLLPDP